MSYFSIQENSFTMDDLLSDKVYRINLVIMVLAWSASSFNFFIIGFYIKYIPGNIFNNVISTSIADAVSASAVGVIVQHWGAKKTMLASFGCAALGGILLIMAGENQTYILWMMFVTRFGINCAFSLCYIITAEYFPPIVCSRVFGICNLFARLATILSPLLAEITPPFPMVIYIMICIILMIASLFLTKSEDIDDAMQDLDDSISMHSSNLFSS